jgi:hypothetical protein
VVGPDVHRGQLDGPGDPALSRVSGFFAVAIHSRIRRLDDGGTASKFDRAAALSSRPALRSAGSSRSVTLPARGEPELGAVLVVLAVEAVDPAVAERVLDRLVVAHARRPAVLVVTWATLLIETRFVPILRDHFGRHCHIEVELDEERSRVRVAAPTPRDIARNLAGWGSMVEVLEPHSVRSELARIGTEPARRYAGAR